MVRNLKRSVGQKSSKILMYIYKEKQTFILN